MLVINAKVVLIILYFELFINIFVLKKEKEKLKNKMCNYFAVFIIIFFSDMVVTSEHEI